MNLTDGTIVALRYAHIHVLLWRCEMFACDGRTQQHNKCKFYLMCWRKAPKEFEFMFTERTSLHETAFHSSLLDVPHQRLTSTGLLQSRKRPQTIILQPSVYFWLGRWKKKQFYYFIMLLVAHTINHHKSSPSFMDDLFIHRLCGGGSSWWFHLERFPFDRALLRIAGATAGVAGATLAPWTQDPWELQLWKLKKTNAFNRNKTQTTLWQNADALIHLWVLVQAHFA